MKSNHLFKLFAVSMFVVFLLAACGGNDEAEGNTDDRAESENDDSSQEDGSSTDEQEDESSESDSSEEDTSGAVSPQSASETVSFEQVTWIGGVPDRRPDPGIWYYTEDDHPEKYASTFDWEKEDVLLWQIGDEKYQGYDPDTRELEIMDDDVIKIVVELEEDDTDDRAPRNYLKVPKDKLEGKSFIIETVDGEQLSVE
ncbi:hypothetical protein SAMN04488072_104145 [Lentibacillus halodurans]|uniref:Lipoprotein n=1 Tax=Lentibacillus halodurans TaxID=237679 RepID=A0A1I0X4C8_9BACI|nr:hypothetical protein [Lentibacillus halodurans]SFA95781.1 hypothetical protein SAMN04488072_104145 [Lentibacillus halodurans]